METCHGMGFLAFCPPTIRFEAVIHDGIFVSKLIKHNYITMIITMSELSSMLNAMNQHF